MKFEIMGFLYLETTAMYLHESFFLIYLIFVNIHIAASIEQRPKCLCKPVTIRSLFDGGSDILCACILWLILHLFRMIAIRYAFTWSCFAAACPRFPV